MNTIGRTYAISHKERRKVFTLTTTRTFCIWTPVLTLESTIIFMIHNCELDETIRRPIQSNGCQKRLWSSASVYYKPSYFTLRVTRYLKGWVSQWWGWTWIWWKEEHLNSGFDTWNDNLHDSQLQTGWNNLTSHPKWLWSFASVYSL